MKRLYLLAEAGGAPFAVPADAVDSVVPCGEIVPVPLSSPPVAGIVALRSRVITVIEVLGSIDGSTTKTVGGDRAIIVVSLDGHLYGLIVDDVHDVIEFEGEQQQVGAAFEPGWQRVSTGMIEVEGKAVAAIDPAALISPGWGVS